ncbi:MAG: TerC family protein [Alphaproteobacteria bacterium]|nr:TerC family protein [Alphaproteobacteria bacterium]
MDYILQLLVSPEAWISLLTLTILEIVLGIDNIIFLSIVTGRLPPEQQKLARQIGLGLALVMRIILLCMIAWIAGLTAPIVTIMDHTVSWRDVILGAGGLFLLYKGTTEIHHTVEGEEDHSTRKATTFGSAIAQIIVLDMVFSLDSVITAVGMADHLPVMIAAVVIAIIVMLVASEPVSAFVNRHPSVKMLALSFIMLVGLSLCADAMHFHIPRGYLYFAIAFSLLVECLNLMASKKRAANIAARKAAGDGH